MTDSDPPDLPPPPTLPAVAWEPVQAARWPSRKALLIACVAGVLIGIALGIALASG